MNKPVPLNKRFERHVKKIKSGCHIWISGLDHSGYGKFGSVSAHRTAYELYREEIPAGMSVHHTCGVTFCVNPKHLQLVTTKQNSQMQANRPTVFSKKCNHDDSNAYYYTVKSEKPSISGKGKHSFPERRRVCRICRSAYKKETREKMKSKRDEMLNV